MLRKVKVETMGDTEIRTERHTGDLLARLEKGELAIGYNLLGPYAQARIAAGAPLAIVYPRDYTLVVSRTAVLPASAPNTEGAHRFLEYLVSTEGQQTLANVGGLPAIRSEASALQTQRGIVSAAVGPLRPVVLGPGLLDAALGDAPAADEAAPELGPEATTGPRAALAGLYRSGRTGQPITVAAFRDGLTLNGWSGYRDSGVGTFVNAAGTRALRFDPPPAGIALPLRFVSIGPGGDTIDYERVAPWTPTPAERRAFVGGYRSDEVDAAWRTDASGDTLLLVGRGGVRDPLEPVYRDAFTGSNSGWLVTFTRGARGAVTGFEVGMTRTRRVPFRRTP